MAALRSDDVGEIMPKRYLAGFVVLSCVFSYVGTWTAFELLHRRTSWKGFYNWVHLFGASVTLGGVAVWGMWFIGNRAINLGDGSQPYQISYAASFIALSFFVPIIVFLISFCILGSVETFSLWTIIRTIVAAVLTAVGVASMHYIGQAGIINYDCIYHVAYAIGSAFLVAGSFTVGLLMFVMFRASWHSDWWKRGLCAMLVASAIGSSNWLASVGTEYRFRKANRNAAINYKNSTIVIFVIVLVCACAALVGLMGLAHKRQKRAMYECQRVAIAAAFFDHSGNIMVTPEGFLPTRRIADEYYEKNIYDAFTNRHPLFLWMFRASHYWPSVLPLLPAMRAHLQQLGLKIHRMGSRVSSRSGSHIGFKLTTATGERIEQYSLVFRELFCVAASELASVLRVDLERLGILYNEVVPTGTNLDEYPTLQWFRSYPRAVKEHTDEETARGLIIGRGQLLFIVNQVSAADVATFRSNGFRFASLKDVLPIISRTMQVPKMHFQSYIDKMRRYVGRQEFREPGIFMSCFVVRPSLKSGFDVVVCKRFVNMLPSVQLPISMLQKWQEDYLRQLDSFNIASMRERLIKDSRSVDTNTHKRIFTTQLLEALEKLRRRFTEGSLSEATFIAQTFQAPCRSSALGLTAATLLSFRMIVPVHMRQPPGNDLVFWPLNMFKTQQRVYKQSRDPVRFARRVYREFAPVILTQGQTVTMPEATQLGRMGLGRLLIGELRNLHYELEVGHYFDADGNVVRQQLQSVPKSINVHRIIRPFHVSPKVQTIDQGRDNEEIKVASGSKHVLDDHMPPLRLHPTDDLRMLSGKTKTGQVSLVMKEDLEPATFVDEIFARCIETKINSTYEAVVRHALPEVWD